MDKKQFERYAFLKSQIKLLEEEAKVLAPEILKMVDSTEEKKVESEFGMFSIMTRKNWKYTGAVETMQSEVDRMKEEEIATGKAVAVETKSIRFDLPKNEKE